MDVKRYAIPILTAKGIQVNHGAGKITVQESDKEKEVLLLVKRGKSSTIPLEVVEEGDFLRIITHIPSYYEWSTGEETDFDFYVPRGFSVGVSNKKGNLRVMTKGQQNLEVKIGDIFSRGVEEIGRFVSKYGNITVEQMGSIRRLEAKTNVGNVYLRVPYGGLLSVSAKTRVGQVKSNRKNNYLMRLDEPGEAFSHFSPTSLGNVSVQTGKGDIYVIFDEKRDSR